MRTHIVLRYLYPGLTPMSDYYPQGATFVWAGPGASPTAQEMLDAELPAEKAHRIATNRAECSRRIFERYPAGRQLSASFGLYPPENVQAMTDWIAATVAAENAAADAIDAATTVQDVEAVSVSWPA